MPLAADADVGAARTSPSASSAGRRLRFVGDPNDAADADDIVLDTTWTPPAGAGPTSVRDVAEAVLSSVDLIAETSSRLDAWARTSGIIDRLTIRGTSFWYYVRLRHWAWLQDRILWALIVDRIVRDRTPREIAVEAGTDVALLDVLRLVTARDGIALLEPPPEAPAEAPAEPSHGAAASEPPAAVRPSTPSRIARVVRRQIVRVRNTIRKPPPKPPPAWVVRREVGQARAAIIRGHLDRLADAAESDGARRLLVVHEHARQRIDTPGGVIRINAYLDPIVDRLAGTELAPVRVDIRAQAGRDADWARIGEGADPNILTVDALTPAPQPVAAEPARPAAGDDPARPIPAPGAATARPAVTEPEPLPWASELAGSIEVAGLDLAPLLAAMVAREAARWLPNMDESIARIERFLVRIRPRAILLADEYHRQDWMVAAAAAGIPVAAVQHGMIYGHHNGYIHAERPATLRLPNRTYVFGRWERDLLIEQSVYRPDEVVVGGSPRIDLIAAHEGDPIAIRRELGVADDERLVVVSGTWGSIYRQIHYPIALAGIVDRQLPGVHVVVKLHPGEPDDGPYRAILESAAAARGVDPPPVSVVRDVDLYRLLAAADAHLGIHSTVLTEAVVTRTPNLLSARLAAADLLGYVDAGVAVPVRDGGDVLGALGAGRAVLAEADAADFTAAHFEPGAAADRIAADLRAWLA